ncbi:MAG: 2-oxo acid dehydrogenase subunit E2, partial [Nevskiales bacterium]
ELRGYTITLSNYGVFGGRYSDPVIVPPCVAILGAGRIREQVVARDGQPAVRPVMPLSLSFDHRCVTGGEATRFLMAAIEDLQKPE